jgi:hypothetical protein
MSFKGHKKGRRYQVTKSIKVKRNEKETFTKEEEEAPKTK